MIYEGSLSTCAVPQVDIPVFLDILIYMNTKSDVLKILEQNKGTPVSGSMIAGSLGVSRNAVWKAITSLRDGGYDIRGGSGKGYTLAPSSDILSAEGIAPLLREYVSVTVLDEIDSTNMEAKRYALDNRDCPALIVANSQSAGRGRLGKSFYSPAGTGIYMSFLLRPTFDLGKAMLITTAAAVAAAKAIRTVTERQCRIKWVNDLFLDDKKICGILTEGVTDIESGTLSHLVVGIGVNCKENDFPADAGEAGAIGGDFSRNALAAEIANEFIPMAVDPSAKDFIAYYRENSLVLGKDILVHRQDGKTLPAKALDIDSYCRLLVEFSDGSKEALSTGSITLR